MEPNEARLLSAADSFAAALRLAFRDLVHEVADKLREGAEALGRCRIMGVYSPPKDPPMGLSKRDQAHIERRLVATLTEACETAKAQIVGFVWLTHEVDYAEFPASLRIVWVFDTEAHKNQALAAGQGECMVELTAIALDEADVLLSPVAAHVQFDSEEQCQRANAGNWPQRLARKRSTRG